MFVPCPCIHWGAPWWTSGSVIGGSSGSFEVAGSIWVCPGGRPVRLGCLGSLDCALGDIGFVWGRWVLWGAPWGSCLLEVAGCIWCALRAVRFVLGVFVHWGAPWESAGSFGVVRFIGKRPAGRRVRLGSLGSLGCALSVVRFLWGRWVHWGTPRWSSGSFGDAGFIGKRPWARQVRSGSLGSFGCALGFVGFV